VDVHRGGRYVPLSAARARGAPAWAPVVPRGPLDSGEDAAAAGAGAAGAMGRLALTDDSGGGGAPAGGVAANAALRVSLQRLFAPTGPGARRQPMWLYLNHLGKL
jgi:hypothetical protein